MACWFSEETEEVRDEPDLHPVHNASKGHFRLAEGHPSNAPWTHMRCTEGKTLDGSRGHLLSRVNATKWGRSRLARDPRLSVQRNFRHRWVAGIKDDLVAHAASLLQPPQSGPLHEHQKVRTITGSGFSH